MRLETLFYHRHAGWSVPSFPDLDSERTLLLVFAGSILVRHPEPLLALVSAYPRSCVLGCSTAGEIGGSLVRDDSLCAAILRLDRGAVRQVRLRPGRGDASQTGLALGRALLATDLRAVLVLGDAQRDDAEIIVTAMGTALPSVPIAGALAADGDREPRGFVITRDPPGRDEPSDEEGGDPGGRGLISAVGLYGDSLRVGAAIASPGADSEALLAGAEAAAALLPTAKSPRLTLAFSCISRRRHLGLLAERELEAIRRKSAGELLGCYSYGPVGDDPARLSPRSLSLLSLAEES